MRIGIIVDGEAEYRSLPLILERLTPHPVLKVIRADIQPLSSPERIASAVKSRLTILAEKGVDSVIVVLDRENRPDCVCDFADLILSAVTPFAAQSGLRNAAVVVKDRMYENWLIADPENLQRMKKRFRLSESQCRAAGNGNADNADAVEMLKQSVLKSSYSKVEDATRIMRTADPLLIAANSRSFRKFLRTLGCPNYVRQSRLPAS